MHMLPFWQHRVHADRKLTPAQNSDGTNIPGWLVCLTTMRFDSVVRSSAFQQNIYFGFNGEILASAFERT